MTSEVQRDPTLFAVPFMQFLIGILLFAALLQSRRDLTLLCLLVLGLMALARGWSRIAGTGLRLSTSVDRSRAFPGEPLRLEAIAENTRLLPVWLQVTWHPAVGLRAAPGDAARQATLGRHRRVAFRWDAEAPARGVYPLGSPEVQVADPLGLAPRTRAASGAARELVVYPRRVALRPLPVPARDFFGHPGAQSPVQDPIYLLGTRDYQHSQPARHIHWNASARHGRLQEKIFEPSQHHQVMLLLDVASFVEGDGADAFERSLEGIGSLALALDRGGCAVGFAANGRTRGGPPPVLPAARNLRQLPALLELLARLDREPREDLLPALRRGLSGAARTSCVGFSGRPEGLPPEIRGYLLHRRIPLLQVVSGRSRPTPSSVRSPRDRIYRLEEVADIGSGGL